MKNSGCIHFQLKNSSALQASAGTNARHCTAITDNRTAAVIQRNRMTALSNKTSPQSFVSLRSDVPCSTKLPANTPINDTIQKRNINRDNELSTIKSNENTIQLSWLGKAATVLGAGVAGGAAALIGPALGVSALTAATTGAAAYMAYKKMLGGPFIGGHNNIDLLQEGKNQPGSIGIGLTNKKHPFSHSVAVVDNIAMDQSLEGNLSSKELLSTLAGPLNKPEAETSFGHYDNFDAQRGRVSSVSVPVDKSAMALTKANELARNGGQYRLLGNSCTSNVCDVVGESGLVPPFYAKAPTPLSYWMRTMSALQEWM